MDGILSGAMNKRQQNAFVLRIVENYLGVSCCASHSKPSGDVMGLRASYFVVQLALKKQFKNRDINSVILEGDQPTAHGSG
eukprot:scaffold19765_cov23-Prasinocladus_malaysianus.AAC.1